MKTVASALFFAATVAADYGGYGYNAPVVSSVPTVPTVATSSSSSPKLGYTTVYPGYGKEPVTVTSQYQAIPTYVNGQWVDYPYVSKVITDSNGKKVTITKYDQPVTVYSTKKTLTHYQTITVPVYAAPTGYGYGGPKNTTTTTKAYYELYEKIHEVKYNELGPKILPGYPGSPLWTDKDHQPLKIVEYKNGKWSQYTKTFTYGAPKPSATTFEKPGIYTIPSYDVTVEKPSDVPAEATYTAPAGVPVTYGGVTTTVTEATTITAAYPAHKTHGTKTVTVIKYKTIVCPSAGKYEVVKPTTSVYKHATEVVYPSVVHYPAGVYHHSKETVTVTKSKQPYTFSYTQSNSYATKTPEPYPTETPEPSQSGYPTADPSADYPEPTESYGTPYAGYVKRGGMLARRAEAKKAPANKRVILI